MFSILYERVAVSVLGFVKDAEEAVAVAARMCSAWKIDDGTWAKQNQQCSVKLSDLRWALRPAWTFEEGSDDFSALACLHTAQKRGENLLRESM